MVNEEKKLGKGNYGSVYEGRLLPDQPSGSGATSSGDSGLRVAVKKPHREDHVTWMNDLVPSVEDRCALLAEMKVLGEFPDKGSERPKIIIRAVSFGKIVF